MSAPETPGELRARLDALVTAARSRVAQEETRMLRSADLRAFIVALLDAWPAIDALLARLTELEGENKRHRGANLIRVLIRGMDPEWIAEVVSAETFDVIPWRIADGLRARLTAAEAERIELRERLATALMRHCPQCTCPTPDGVG